LYCIQTSEVKGKTSELDIGEFRSEVHLDKHNTSGVWQDRAAGALHKNGTPAMRARAVRACPR
jgi:hypothetical protein